MLNATKILVLSIFIIIMWSKLVHLTNRKALCASAQAVAGLDNECAHVECDRAGVSAPQQARQPRRVTSEANRNGA